MYEVLRTHTCKASGPQDLNTAGPDCFHIHIDTCRYGAITYLTQLVLGALCSRDETRLRNNYSRRFRILSRSQFDVNLGGGGNR